MFISYTPETLSTNDIRYGFAPKPMGGSMGMPLYHPWNATLPQGSANWQGALIFITFGNFSTEIGFELESKFQHNTLHHICITFV